MSTTRLSVQARTESRWGILFISPWIIGFMVFTFIPMIASLFFSFTRYSGRNSPEWIGFHNFTTLFTDPKVWNSLKVTFKFALISIPLNLVAGFFLAYLLNQNVRGMKVWRTVLYLPAMLSGVVVAMLWRGLFDDRYGLVNYLLRQVGLPGPQWLLDPKYTLYCFIFLSIWGVGGGMIIYLAGLQGIQTSYYEAAELDGCNRIQQLVHITIPHMTPIIFFNLVMGIIGTFQYFAEPMILTKGGPAESTMFYNLYLYNNAFKYQSMGYASALAWVLFLLVMVLTLLVFRSSSMWVFYEGEVKGK
ncbi:sugar ABC transporter permease [Treponema zuelzerae]|uniref:Sugar ABC transporter permease n=1 Tax=Teretinema zuelzerae TaxID=156 RepID=A0AAE3EH28_9SPIR|nr:sugar ABC transporter permease [Teretinema zuelzerae]MCD1654045.1 sugar ABC transporter permease [Teretinema zuelzerae]